MKSLLNVCSSPGFLYPEASPSSFADSPSPTLGNILPDSTAAPALQGQQRELEKHMRADSLEQKIQHRPKPEELIKEGILAADEDPTKE